MLGLSPQKHTWPSPETNQLSFLMFFKSTCFCLPGNEHVGSKIMILMGFVILIVIWFNTGFLSVGIITFGLDHTLWRGFFLCIVEAAAASLTSTPWIPAETSPPLSLAPFSPKDISGQTSPRGQNQHLRRNYCPRKSQGGRRIPTSPQA